MTTISAGAAAGLLVALMVVATGDSRGAELVTHGRTDADLVRDAAKSAVGAPLHLPVDDPAPQRGADPRA